MRLLTLRSKRLHIDQQGELRKVIEALAVGTCLLTILCITIVMCNGELFKSSGSAVASGNRQENAPGPMINTIIKSDKVADTITNDLTKLRGQVEGKKDAAQGSGTEAGAPGPQQPVAGGGQDGGQ